MEVANNIHEELPKDFFNRYLDSFREGSQIVGSFFEELTKELFEGHIDRLKLNRFVDICPDLQESKRQEFFIECKAAKAHTYYKGSKSKRIEWKMTVSREASYTSFLDSYFPDVSLENPDFNPVLLYTFWGYDIGSKKIGDFDNSKKLIESLTYSDMRLYLVDSFVLSKICQLKTLSDAPSREEMYRVRHADFKLLDSDKWSEFAKKWNIPVEDCFYASCEKSGLEINNKQVNNFPVRVLLSKDSYSKESIMNFLENNILGGNNDNRTF